LQAADNAKVMGELQFRHVAGTKTLYQVRAASCSIVCGKRSTRRIRVVA